MISTQVDPARAAAAGAAAARRARPPSAASPDPKLSNVEGMEHDPAIAGLYALVAPHAARLLGPHDAPRKVQVAVRFPDPSGRGPRPIDGKRWHVDGFRTGAHSPFDLLVGVALTATPSYDAGNLAVHPRTHKTVLALARRSERNIRDLHYSKHDFGSAPLQLRFAVGDVARAGAGTNALRRVCDVSSHRSSRTRNYLT